MPILEKFYIFALGNSSVQLNFCFMSVDLEKRKRKILTHQINTLLIRHDVNDDKCCFDVLVDGLQLTSSLTLGELLEFIARVFMSKNHSVCYCDDYGKIDIR